MQKKQMPGQRPGEDLKDFIDRTWKADRKVQREFDNDFEAYASFCRAEAANNIKILGGS